jgi:hypothetical protein
VGVDARVVLFPRSKEGGVAVTVVDTRRGEFTLMVRLSLVVEPNLSTTFIVTENVPVPLNVITLSM